MRRQEGGGAVGKHSVQVIIFLFVFSVENPEEITFNGIWRDICCTELFAVLFAVETHGFSRLMA